MAKNEEEVKNSVFGFGESNEAFAKYFIGKSYLKGLASSKEAKAAVSNVTFEPGCRNNWHEHTVPQILVAVAGEDWYQEEGKPAKKMLPGDVVIVNPIAIMVGESKNTWYGPVTDEEYNKLS